MLPGVLRGEFLHHRDRRDAPASKRYKGVYRSQMTDEQRRCQGWIGG